MSRPKYFIKTEVMVYGGRTKYYVVKGFSDEDQIAKVGSERDATRLCEEFERLTDEVARLKAEVERLRKAGDNLARAIDDNGCHDNGDWYDQQNAMYAWNAAKEVQS